MGRKTRNCWLQSMSSSLPAWPLPSSSCGRAPSCGLRSACFYLQLSEISNLNGEIAFFCSFFSIFPINHTVKRMQCQCDSTKGWVAGPYAPKILALRKIRLLTVLLMRLVKGSVMGSVLGLVKRSVWGDIAPPKLKSLTVPGLPSKYSPRTCVSGSSS